MVANGQFDSIDEDAFRRFCRLGQAWAAHDDVKECAFWFSVLSSVAERMASSRYRVALVGPFSAGKTTFLNGLLRIEGDDALPTGLSETTAIPTVVRPAERRSLRYWSDGRLIEATQEMEKEFRGLRPDSVGPLLKQYLQTQHEIVLELHSPQLAEHVEFLDLPGIGGANARHSEQALRWAFTADAVLYVMNGEQGTLSKDDKEFLEKLKGANKRISICVTHLDLRPNPDPAIMLDGIRKEAAALNIKNSLVFGGSIGQVDGSFLFPLLRDLDLENTRTQLIQSALAAVSSQHLKELGNSFPMSKSSLSSRAVLAEARIALPNRSLTEKVLIPADHAQNLSLSGTARNWGFVTEVPGGIALFIDGNEKYRSTARCEYFGFFGEEWILIVRDALSHDCLNVITSYLEYRDVAICELIHARDMSDYGALFIANDLKTSVIIGGKEVLRSDDFHKTAYGRRLIENMPSEEKWAIGPARAGLHPDCSNFMFDCGRRYASFYVSGGRLLTPGGEKSLRWKKDTPPFTQTVCSPSGSRVVGIDNNEFYLEDERRVKPGPDFQFAAIGEKDSWAVVGADGYITSSSNGRGQFQFTGEADLLFLPGTTRWLATVKKEDNWYVCTIDQQGTSQRFGPYVEVMFLTTSSFAPSWGLAVRTKKGWSIVANGQEHHEGMLEARSPRWSPNGQHWAAAVRQKDGWHVVSALTSSVPVKACSDPVVDDDGTIRFLAHRGALVTLETLA